MASELTTDNEGTPIKDLEEAVFISIGAASVCWEKIERAGVFDSSKARGIGDALVKWIRENQHMTVTVPWLGLATTKELLEELAVRMKIHSVPGSTGQVIGNIANLAIELLPVTELEYRTVDGS